MDFIGHAGHGGFCPREFFLGNGKFFWFYEHPFSTTYDAVKGSFTNRNHFADFIAVGIGPWIWWIHTTWNRRPAGSPAASFGTTASPNAARIGWLAVGLAVIVFAGVLSLCAAESRPFAWRW